MLNTPTALGGMVTAPHHLASEAGVRVLRDGGNAVEAMVAMAAAIAVVYPHMNAVGGDGFWLIAEKGKAPVGIDAAGQSAGLASPAFYQDQGLDQIPSRGPGAALTVAGTIGGWAEALKIGGGKLPLSRLLEDAIRHANDGVPVTVGQHELTLDKLDGLINVPGFAETYLRDGAVPAPGDVLRQPALGATLAHLVEAGLDDFYRGDIARANAKVLTDIGSPLRLSDLEAYQAKQVAALQVKTSAGTVYNMPPPTQGVSSLMILALFDRLGVKTAEGFDFVHGLVEATKQAFILRNAELTDPAFMSQDVQAWLDDGFLDDLAANIDMGKALAWPVPTKPGDTIWMGAIDADGRAVSFIQSIFWEYGSGGNRCAVAKSGPRLHIGRRASERLGAGQATIPYAESGDGIAQRRHGAELRHHGRRRAAADPGRRVRALCLLPTKAAGICHRAALAFGSDVGRGKHDLESGKSV